MSRDNKVEINAGGSVSVEALAVGDHAKAASIRSPQAQEVAAQFLDIREIFEQLEASGALKPAEAKLLKEESAEVETAAQDSLKAGDDASKDTLAAKLRRFGASIQAFCHEQDRKGVFAALRTVATVCAIPLALLGFPVP